MAKPIHFERGFGFAFHFKGTLMKIWKSAKIFVLI